MKKNYKSIIALCIGASLCAAAFSGCSSESQDSSKSDAKAKEMGKVETIATFSLPEASEESDVFVAPIEGISDDFIRGMDASAVLSIENSGAKYYNYDGEEQDVFMTLAESGVNYIRLRIWNDPYDENGNGYGGGNNDLETAVKLGVRATQYGMKVSIDFHYSDFWADPKRQNAPKAWEDMSLEEKTEALYDYTKESLTELLDAGVDIGMVQIGNEINNGMAGETDSDAVMQLLEAGSKAVREISEEYVHDIQVAVHYTNINSDGTIAGIAAQLKDFGLDYDIFGLSYYPFWDGNNENMQNIASMLKKDYGKQVMIAETSYCYTSEDGDGYGNSLVGTDDLVEGYAASVQSQATMIRDICEAANEVDVIGVFYWEGTWIPVGDADEDNSALWEKYGSGWASSYAADYDPDDAGLYYGGCSWDNQAFFDFDGYPLASLNVFKYLKYGSTAELKVDFIPDVNVICDVGTELKLPEEIDVVYNDRSANKKIPVVWNEEQRDAIDTNVGGTYEVEGLLEDGTKITASIEILMVNHVKNSSFEESDTSMWNVSYEGDINPTDFQSKAADAYTGDIAFHFWSADSDMEFAIEQEFTDLEAGTYQLSVFSQGGDVTDAAEMELYAVVNGEELTEEFMVTSYADWQNPTITNIKVTDGTLTIGVRMKCNPKSWGTVDDFTLNRISD